MPKPLAIHGGTPAVTGPQPNWPVFDDHDEQALVRALRSAKWGRIHGDETARFEQRFAAYQHCKHGIAVVNGTVALRIALLAADIQAGDEVIVPAYTFIASASSVVECNATPVFVDIDPRTYCIDPAAVERAITPRTRVIMPVHIGGRPADMDAIMAIAKKHKLIVIEDAAQAHGAEYKGRRAGSIGHLGTFSFQSSKNLNAGEGGMIVTNDDALAEAARSIHNCGRSARGAWYGHYRVAGNYRMSEFHAALLGAQMDRLDEQTERRSANAKHLSSRLSALPGLCPQKWGPDVTRHTVHLYVLRYDENAWGLPRQVVLDTLKSEGLYASPGYQWPVHRQPMFTERAFGPYSAVNYRDAHCPVADHAADHEGIWLMQKLMLADRAVIDQVADAFEKVYQNREKLAEPVTAPPEKSPGKAR